MKKGYDSLSQATMDLRKDGYETDFDLIKNGIKSKELDKEWDADQIDVKRFYRFEGMTNPGDNTILYVIECNDGTKGVLVDSYGANQEISKKMIEKLRTNQK